MPQAMSTNPFFYGGIAQGDSFTDRDAELAELAADLRTGQNVVLISPRRLGKTSPLFRAARVVRFCGQCGKTLALRCRACQAGADSCTRAGSFCGPNLEFVVRFGS